MAGALVQVATATVTSDVATVQLLGINSDDVYMVAFHGHQGAADSRTLYVRFTASGTANSTSNYKRVSKNLRTDTDFSNNGDQSLSEFRAEQTGTGTHEKTNGIYFLYNFNNSSERSFLTNEGVGRNAAGTLSGKQGGCILNVTEANDGIEIFTSGGNIQGGTYTLYKVV